MNLQTIYAESTDLLKRFDLKPTFAAASRKFIEELWEAHRELSELADTPKNIPAREDSAKELCDVLITLCNLLYAEHMEESYLAPFVSSFGEKYECLTTDTMSERECGIELNVITYQLYTALIVTRFGLTKEQRSSAVMPIVNQLISALVRLAKKVGIGLEELDCAMEATYAKNRKKTADTHHVINGQIARKPAEAQS